MAVPKKRTGARAQATRRANWKATKVETTTCSTCGEPALTHTVCTACGNYKGEPVKLKDKAAKAAEVKPAKKAAAKKATKKVEEVKEAPVETVEETKVEAVVEETKEDEKSVEE